MKQVSVAIFLAMTLLLLSGEKADAASRLQIINNSGSTITAIYCSTNSKVWGNNRLDGVLRPGESFSIRSSPVTTNRYVSVKVNFGNRNRIWEHIDLNQVSVIRVG